MCRFKKKSACACCFTLQDHQNQCKQVIMIRWKISRSHFWPWQHLLLIGADSRTSPLYCSWTSWSLSLFRCSRKCVHSYRKYQFWKLMSGGTQVRTDSSRSATYPHERRLPTRNSHYILSERCPLSSGTPLWEYTLGRLGRLDRRRSCSSIPSSLAGTKDSLLTTTPSDTHPCSYT